LDQCHTVEASELPFEYMMNRLRLSSAFCLSDYQAYTGLSPESLLPLINKAKEKKLLMNNENTWQVTTLGHRYLNDLLEMFL
jgi:oxygen-independent coproporphyrinogen-3 oxidase